MEQKKSIQFHFLEKASLRQRRVLKQFLLGVFKKHRVQVAHINYVFCSDAYLLRINRQFLKHNTYTDIITFPLSQGGAPMLADIYISIERVRENARSLGVSFESEFHRVIFHGALHLCGYNDKTPVQKRDMRIAENQLLAQYGFHVKQK